MSMNVTAATLKNETAIKKALPFCLTETQFGFADKIQGKVRDTYDLGDKLLLITTDRQSAFDRLLASVPYKGQVLNLVSAWWFEKTAHLVPNHLLAIPDPNVIIAKKCDVLPIEFVVRGYMTGTTNTSLWTQYQNGVRDYCGIQFPEGLQKNQKLDQPVLTPTTKEVEHDRPISPAEIVQEGWLSQADWDQARTYALKLFEFGSQVAKEHGLILVDTKYEFGRDADGRIVLIDELHTPDSSRFWLDKTYHARLAEGLEPDNFDKEFLRLWFKEHCDPYHDKILPHAPEELVITLADRYIQSYEMITKSAFKFMEQPGSVAERIKHNVMDYI